MKKAVTSAPNVVDFDTERAAEEAAKTLPDFSEDETALAFADRHHEFLRFDHSTGKWYVYNSGRWQRDPKQMALHYARTFGRLLAEDRRFPNSVRLRSLKFAQNVDRLARTDPRMAVTSDIWDADLDLLGTPNTVINLVTGEEVEPHPDLYITRAVAVDPNIATNCINWLRFLNDITGKDEAFKRFLQQWAAYCLSRRTDQQKLLFITGAGGTGKSSSSPCCSRCWPTMPRPPTCRPSPMEVSSSIRSSSRGCRACAWSLPAKPRKAVIGKRTASSNSAAATW